MLLKDDREGIELDYQTVLVPQVIVRQRAKIMQVWLAEMDFKSKVGFCGESRSQPGGSIMVSDHDAEARRM